MNGYILEPCKSDVKYFSEGNEWRTIINQFVNAKAVAWYYDAIVFYNIEGGKWNEPIREELDEKLVRLRVFNTERELHIWRSNGFLKGRLRTDTEGTETAYVEARQIMNGTSFEKLADGGVTATEDKGTSYEMPYSELEKNIEKAERIVLITRNYIDYNDIGQAGYVDSRFIDYEISKK